MVLTAAMHSKSAAASAITAASAPAAQPLAPGVPADFPTAPGLSPCKPTTSGPLVTCKWHGVNGPAVYKFYKGALPKAGYTMRDSKESTTPSYSSAMSFIKGNVKGAMTIDDGELEVDFVIG
jgi:hypothetical protein